VTRSSRQDEPTARALAARLLPLLAAVADAMHGMKPWQRRRVLLEMLAQALGEELDVRRPWSELPERQLRRLLEAMTRG